MGAWFKSCLCSPNAIGALDAPADVCVAAPDPFQAVRSGIVPTTTRNNGHAEEAVCSTGLHRR
jgi:hypothetical protein